MHPPSTLPVLKLDSLDPVQAYKAGVLLRRASPNLDPSAHAQRVLIELPGEIAVEEWDPDVLVKHVALARLEIAGVVNSSWVSHLFSELACLPLVNIAPVPQMVGNVDGPTDDLPDAPAEVATTDVAPIEATAEPTPAPPALFGDVLPAGPKDLAARLADDISRIMAAPPVAPAFEPAPAQSSASEAFAADVFAADEIMLAPARQDAPVSEDPAARTLPTIDLALPVLQLELVPMEDPREDPIATEEWEHALDQADALDPDSVAGSDDQQQFESFDPAPADAVVDSNVEASCEPPAAAIAADTDAATFDAPSMGGSEPVAAVDPAELAADFVVAQDAAFVENTHAVVQAEVDLGAAIEVNHEDVIDTQPQAAVVAATVPDNAVASVATAAEVAADAGTSPAVAADEPAIDQQASASTPAIEAPAAATVSQDAAPDAQPGDQATKCPEHAVTNAPADHAQADFAPIDATVAACSACRERIMSSGEDIVATDPAGEAVTYRGRLRAGQVCENRIGDLVLVGTMGTGAVARAAGSIHAYGRASGALKAGQAGDTTARIYVADFNAQLVDIAGRYQSFETIPEDLKGKMVEIWLEEDVLLYQAI